MRSNKVKLSQGNISLNHNIILETGNHTNTPNGILKVKIFFIPFENHELAKSKLEIGPLDTARQEYECIRIEKEHDPGYRNPRSLMMVEMGIK